MLQQQHVHACGHMQTGIVRLATVRIVQSRADTCRRLSHAHKCVHVQVMLGKWMFVTLRTGGTPGAVAAILDEASGLTASRGNCSNNQFVDHLIPVDAL